MGLSLTEADVADVEEVKRRLAGEAKNDRLMFDLADALAASELVYIETCNRVEVVYARELGEAPSRRDIEDMHRALGADPGLAGRLRFVSGRAAARHLFRVVSSLDSLVHGDDQILAQVRSAFARAEEMGLVGPLLAPVFSHAFQVGKQVRTKTDLSRHSISVMSLGVATLRERLPEGTRPRIAIVGAGETATHVARALDGVGLGVDFVANRTVSRALELAEAHGAVGLSLDEFRRDPRGVDVLIAATGAPGYLFSRSELERIAGDAQGGAGLLALDLAVPRDLEPVGSARGGTPVTIIDLEDLRENADRNRALRAAAASEAEELVERRLVAYEERAREKEVATRIEALVSESRELLEREWRRFGEKELAGLDPAERGKIERWARSTFGRLTHLSATAAKELARAAPRSLDGEEEEETIG